MTVVYTTAVLLYYKIPVSIGIIDSLIFTLILFGLGFSMFFAIRYMDVGIKALPELVIAHFTLAALVTFLSIYLTRTAESFVLLQSKDFPETLVQGQAFIGVLLYSLIVMIYYLSNYQESLVEKQKSEEDLKGLLQEAELSLLKSQLNPHFIFNSLNSISSLTITNADKAREMVVKLSEFLRYSLGKGKDEFVEFQEEIKNANIFFDIEKTRFGDRLKIIQEINESSLKHHIPVLILQPLIENAVKYSMYDTISEATIRISAYLSGEELIVHIENPYDPIDRSSKGKGIGLSNVRSRLALLYNGRSKLIIGKSGNIYKVTLQIPLLK